MADELAAVAETRGLGRPGVRCHYRPPSFKRRDYITFALTIVVLSFMAGIGYIWQ
jgi:energy-coupling factor transporter transmembrane protein EcfT